MSDMSQLARLAEALLSPSPLEFVIALIVVIATPIFLHSYLAGSSSVTTLPSILLIGPLGSGKTSLQTLLERGQSASTHTSQAPLTVECSLPVGTTANSDKYRSVNDPTHQTHKRFFLVDTPGHGKLRQHALDSISDTKNLKGIIFVVDAADLTPGEESVRLAAEYLHDTLLLLQKRLTCSKTSRAPKEMHVLVAANKMDLFTALPPNAVRSTLEKEIGKIRISRSKGLLDSGAGAGHLDEESDEWLGETGSTQFKFEQMAESNVFVEVLGGSSATEHGGEAQKWWSWIAERM